ncbi:MAG: cytochrome P450 [Acidobacteria bacterium]|nr:MAG: cytochrome P450 [Acidobacteriota bacterium]REK10651.1 MAG: cytochrome P450 [Acidobacteriota bacterium]
MPLDPYQVELEAIDVAQPHLFQARQQYAYFERLRKEAPVHYSPSGEFGPYWSITRYEDIQYVDTHHHVFSSEPAIVLQDPQEELPMEMFIAMDPPKHDRQRKEVSPVVGPRNLAVLQHTIRERVCNILDSLPRNETFNWVDLVSIELTTQMLATLFDFPFEDRRKLTWWSDVATARVEPGGLCETDEERREILRECLTYFMGLWEQRKDNEDGNDLISMLARGESTRDMPPMEFLGNLILLIVGGNDTTRNSISGGLVALDEFPDEMAKLRANPELIPNMVSEIIRWQTPLAYMRRRANQDTTLGGHTIREGDKVAMWYASGNRDPEIFADADRLLIDRDNARRHMSFGFGVHRCMGNRLAEMQLRILWEEILPRFPKIEIMGDPVRVRSTFVQGYTELPVRLPA